MSTLKRNKLVIFDGLDNTGKDTLINMYIQYMSERNNDTFLIHAESPKSNISGETGYSKLNRAFTNYNRYIEKISALINAGKVTSTDWFNCFVMNRSWFDEYVYGQMYRQEDPALITDSIQLFMNNTVLPLFDDGSEIYVIHLDADPAFALRNEDNKSLSEGNTELIGMEKALFNEVFSVTGANTVYNYKKLIVHDENLNFIDKDVLFSDILNFLND